MSAIPFAARLPWVLWVVCLAGAVLGQAGAQEKARPAPARVVHALVALCDNATQGIQKVPAKIGNGDDPDSNLYWGCSDGLRAYFKKSASWRLVESRREAPPAVVLERCVFKHKTRDVWLVAHAYRGAEMKACLTAFLEASAGLRAEPVEVKDGTSVVTLAGPGGADFLAFIGHNGLMDQQLAFQPTRRAPGATVPVAVFCCVSDSYFTAGLRYSGAEPVLMTSQLMYPGAFLLSATLEGWLAGEAPPRLLERAAAAYARNQGISVKAARGVFRVPAPAEKTR